MNHIINQEKRIWIYHNISKHPYLHFRELTRLLQMPSTTLNYHLRHLEKNGLIISKKEDRHTRYCISNNVGNTEKKLLKVLRQDTPRNVLLYIFLCASASQIEIAKELEKHPTTIEYHLKKLEEMDIIEPAPVKKGIINAGINNLIIIKRKPHKNEIFYKIKDPANLKVYAILLKYYNKKTINDSTSESVINYIEYVAKGNLSKIITTNEKIKDAPSKRIKTTNQVLETFEKIVFEIFPHPYHG